jgi:hypothetical protein
MAARLHLSRRRGFDLQATSLALNGLPARLVTRPGLFGNPFATARTFRRFLRRMSAAEIMRAIQYEDGEPALVEGMGFIILRNRIRANIWHLRGHNLACWCKPDAACHADVYLDLLATDWPERWKRQYPAICEEVKPKQRKD